MKTANNTTTAAATEKATRSEILRIPASMITVNDRNIREDLGDLAPLKAYIKANGTTKLPPILVRKNSETEFDLIHGFRRVTAINELRAEGVNVEKIKASKVPANYSNKDEIYDHVAQNGGKELTPFEQAKAFKMLDAEGETRKEIAVRAGVTVAHVANMLKITKAGKDAQKAMKEGLITPTLVLLTMNKHGDKADAVITEAIKVAKAAGKTKVTQKSVDKATGGTSKRISSNVRKVNNSIAFISNAVAEATKATLELEKAEADKAEIEAAKQAEETLAEEAKAKVEKLDKVAKIVAVLEGEKDIETIAAKLIEIM